MQALVKNGLTSVILRLKVGDSTSTSGAGKTGLAYNTSGLVISTIADSEASATAYTAAAGTIDTITTPGSFAAPAAGHCRFREVDAAHHPGLYELQLADARWAVSGARSVVVTVGGAAGAVQTDTLVQCDLSAADGLPTVGTGAGQLNPDGSGNIGANLTAAALQKAAREVYGAAGTVWHVWGGGSNADGLTWATAKTGPSGLATAAGDVLLLAAGQTFTVGASAVALADGVSILGGGASVVASAGGAVALVTWGGPNARLADVTIDASAAHSLPPLAGGVSNTALANARLDRVSLRGVIDCLIFAGGDLVAADCDFRTGYTQDASGRALGQSGFAGDGGYADATNLSGGTVRFVGGLLRSDGKGYESARALTAGAGAAVWAEETILEALNPPPGGRAYAIYAAGAGTGVQVTGKRVAGSPYDVFSGSGATVTLTDVAGSGPNGAITVDPAGTGTVVTRGKSTTAAPASALVASAVWAAAARTITGAASPVPTTTSGAGPYALTHDGGTGTNGTPVTVNGTPAAADRLRVVDDQGNGVAGATLRLYLASDTTFSNPLAATTTAADGRWAGPLYAASGTYQLVTASPGSQSDSETVVVP